jgi:hypothetical protein
MRCAVALLLGVSAARALSVPSIGYDTRRLILVRADRPDCAAAIAKHVATSHGDDVRFVMTSPAAGAVQLAETLRAAVTPRMIGTLPISTSRMLQDVEGEGSQETAERAMMSRDYVLSGTKDGTASVLISDEGVLNQILTRAECTTAPDDAMCVLLDFTRGMWPDVVAGGVPKVWTE